MKPKKLIVCSVALSLAFAVSAVAGPVKRKAKTTRPQTARQQPSAPDTEWRELLLRTEQVAQQAQAEARLARQQSEELKRRLEASASELASLRRLVNQYGEQLAALRTSQPSDATQTAQARPAAETEPPSLTEKVDRLKEQVEVNTAQLSEHAQTKVESGSRHRIRLSGMILANAYFNSDDSSLTDVPLVALPAGVVSRRNNFGATLRQSRIGLTFDGPRLSAKLGEARVSAEAEFDFWGGTSGESEGDVLGSLRILTASARLDWERTSLIVGQRPPLVSPLNPTSLAAVWFPPMTAAGNLWQWMPQIEIEHRARLRGAGELIMQGGLMLPIGNSVQGRTIEGGPGFESRIAYRRSLDTDRNLEFGLGGYYQRRPFTAGRHVNSYALTSDWLIPLGSRLELSGEAFSGRAVEIGQQSGGRVDRVYAVTGSIDNPATLIRGVRSTGGWLQLAVKARRDLDFNFAFGQNDPRNRDLRSGISFQSAANRNRAGSANVIWQLQHNFLVSFEYRRLWTNYATQQRTNNHYNLAFGYVF